MAFRDVEGIRATSARPMKTRWRPVDLACGLDGDEVIVRTKLARDPESTAVCIAESVSHAFLSACGFRTAEAYYVLVGADFAGDLSAQYDFVPPVRAGRHWGTRLMRRDVQEVEFDAGMVDRLARPADLFNLYLADVVLGNPDRRTFGNVLLAHRAVGGGYDLLPIDQSDAFFHPSAMLDPGALRGKLDRCGAQMLPGTERAVLHGGVEVVREGFARISARRGQVGDLVGEGADEWFDGAGVTPTSLTEFLGYRIATIDDLARKDHWLGLPMAAGGGDVLDLGL